MVSLTQAKALFPKIYRFITEHWKIMLISLASIVILAGIVFQGLFLTKNLREFDKLQKERTSLAGELSYWEQLVKEYGGYRDAYFRMASLQYQLGEIQGAKESLKKVMGLDPNFEEANVLGAKIEINNNPINK